MTTRTHGRGRAVLALATVVFALAGCSASAKNSSPTPAGAQAERADGAAAPAPAAVPPADGGKAAFAPGGVPTTAPTVESRAIIYTGSITIRVDNVQEIATRVGAIAKSVPNGYISADDRSVNDQQSIAQITLRVPSDNFAETVSAISNLGKEIDRKVSTQDVTAQVIDVTSRVKTQQASVDRVRVLLAKATSISEIVSLESELTRREADLESLESQLANLTDLTSLSTITATLLGPVATTTTPKSKKDTGFVAGLKSGWHTFVSSVNVLLQIIGALLPFAVVIGLVTWVVLRLTRSRRAAAAAARAAAYANRPSVPPRVGVPPAGFLAPPAGPGRAPNLPAPPPTPGSAPEAGPGGRTGTLTAEKDPDGS